LLSSASALDVACFQPATKPCVKKQDINQALWTGIMHIGRGAFSMNKTKMNWLVDFSILLNCGFWVGTKQRWTNANCRMACLGVCRHFYLFKWKCFSRVPK
jgi:hypothetical protein